MSFLEWLAKSPLATFLKVFIAVMLGAAVADWSDSGVISFDDYRTWVIGALVAAVPVIINWLNPQFTLYGREPKPTQIAAAKKVAAKRRPASK